MGGMKDLGHPCLMNLTGLPVRSSEALTKGEIISSQRRDLRAGEAIGFAASNLCA